MKVIIQARHIELSDALRNYCETHLVDHVRRFYDNDAAQLVIQFNDANGSKGGNDQEVHLTFHMPNARAFHVEEVTDDAFKSLDLARDRLIRRVKEEIRRARQPSGHGPLERPLGRTGAAAERQVEARELDPGASRPKAPHIDEPVPSGQK
ncbi:MAG: HPF/RaiA family ribosome-associated protein [Deltaproteobacteria bacterium]|nr:HPF/RaiA family ribosome-associated protein [Deltaproteobacteria bacterium]